MKTIVVPCIILLSVLLVPPLITGQICPQGLFDPSSIMSRLVLDVFDSMYSVFTDYFFFICLEQFHQFWYDSSASTLRIRYYNTTKYRARLLLRNASNIIQNRDTSTIQFYASMASAAYCRVGVNNVLPMTCCACRRFQDEVSRYKVLSNRTEKIRVLITVHPNRSEVVVTFAPSFVRLGELFDFEFVNVTLPRFDPLCMGNGGKVRIHRGFYKMQQAIYPQLLKELKTLLGGLPLGYKVVIQGHSIGGAMAAITLLLLEYHDEFPRRKYWLITYGQPRTGDIDFADAMNCMSHPMVRVVHRNDIVPHIVRANPYPSHVINIGNYYHHLQESWYIRESIRFRVGQNDDGAWNCSVGFYEARICSTSRRPDYLIRDHFEYLSFDFTSCVIEDLFKGLVPLWSQLFSDITTPNPDRPWLIGVWGPTPEWWPAWLPKPKPIGGEPANGWPWNPNLKYSSEGLNAIDEEEAFYAGLGSQTIGSPLESDGNQTQFGREVLKLLLKSYTEPKEEEKVNACDDESPMQLTTDKN